MVLTHATQYFRKSAGKHQPTLAGFIPQCVLPLAPLWRIGVFVYKSIVFTINQPDRLVSSLQGRDRRRGVVNGRGGGYREADAALLPEERTQKSAIRWSVGGLPHTPKHA